MDLVTPLKNGTVEGKGLENLLTRVLPHAQGLLLGSPRHGEGETMNRELRHELLSKTIHTLGNHPVSLFVWISGNTEVQTRENLLALKADFGERIPRGGDFLGGHAA